MKFLWRGLRVELLKLKRTLALAMVVLAPLVVLTLQILLFTAKGGDFLREGVNPWMLMQSVLGLWSVLMLPLFITLETALLAQLEHGNAQWKQLFALPVPRWTFYTTKLIGGLLLIAGSLLILGAGVQLGGLLLLAVEPRMAAGPMLWGQLGRMLGFAFVASFLAVALQTWISLRWHNFTVAIATGIAATVIGFIAANSDTWSRFYPWTLAINSLKDDAPLVSLAAYSVAGSVVVGALGCWNVVRRDVA